MLDGEEGADSLVHHPGVLLAVVGAEVGAEAAAGSDSSEAVAAEVVVAGGGHGEEMWCGCIVATDGGRMKYGGIVGWRMSCGD